MGESDAGWKTVYNQDSAEGIQRNDVLPDSEHKGIKLKPRPVTKPIKKPILENQMPGNIGRPETQITEFTVRNRPQRAPVLFEPSSPSTKEFYYAPAEVTGRRVAGFQESGDQLNLPHDWPEKTPTEYGDSDVNLTVGQDGYSKVEQDSNFSRKPGTWRFRTKDNDLGLQTCDESLPDLRDVGVSEMVYPLQSGLRPIFFSIEAKPSRKKRKEAKAKARKKAETKKPEPEPVAEVRPDPMAEPEGFVQEPVDPKEKREALKEFDEAEAERAYDAEHSSYDRSKGDLAETEQALSEEEKKELQTLPDREQVKRLIKIWYNKLQQGKVGKAAQSNSGYKGNVLEDPALEGLEPKMLDQEKMFTTIRQWEGDSYVNTADHLDVGTKEVLDQKPEGQGHYFSWRYNTEEETGAQVDKDIKKKGFTTGAGKGVLLVERLEGWKKVEAEVMKKRRARPA
jgi:hypothetical protein